jgi:hypothetical protein
MPTYKLNPRQKDQRATFAIYLLEDWKELKNELGRVRARTHMEARRMASERNIGNGEKIIAVQMLTSADVTVIE